MVHCHVTASTFVMMHLAAYSSFWTWCDSHQCLRLSLHAPGPMRPPHHLPLPYRFVVVFVKGCPRPQPRSKRGGGGDANVGYEEDARMTFPLKRVSPLGDSSTMSGAQSSKRFSTISAPWKPASPSSQFTSMVPT
eukprot:scaffold123238_cov24-Tisochrysis_lutea.AAC.3